MVVSALLLAFAAGVVGAWAPWAERGPAQVAVAPPARGGPTGPAPEQPLPTYTPPPAAPEDDLPAAATGLVAARATALRAGDVALLSEVHVPGSATDLADRYALADGALDVSYTVVSARRHGADDEVVRLDLLTTVGAAPPVTERVLVTLQDVGGDWRVAGVSQVG